MTFFSGSVASLLVMLSSVYMVVIYFMVLVDISAPLHFLWSSFCYFPFRILVHVVWEVAVQPFLIIVQNLLPFLSLQPSSFSCYSALFTFNGQSFYSAAFCIYIIHASHANFCYRLHELHDPWLLDAFKFCISFPICAGLCELSLIPLWDIAWDDLDFFPIRVTFLLKLVPIQ